MTRSARSLTDARTHDPSPQPHPLRRDAALAPHARHVAISLPGDPRRRGARERSRDHHRLAQARVGAAQGGSGFLAAHPRHRRARAAEHRRLLQRQGGGDDGWDGARGVRHALGQARGDRRSRHAAAGRVRPRRGGADPHGRRLRGVPVYDRGPRRRRAADRGGLQGADAVGRADRLGQGAQQRVRPARAPSAFSRRPADRRRGPWPALAGGGGDGAWLRRRAAQHRRGQGGRSGCDGARLRPGDRGRPRGVPRRSDATARHGRALDAGGWEGQSFVRGLDPFYPIVDSAERVARLVGIGARLVQLRVKDKDEAMVARETRAALAICAKAGATLVVNDYWRIAIDEGAPWIHLGQADLDGADIAAIRRAGLRLGVSTHDEAELDRALALDPDYVALGPIYPTILKAMAFAPQGLARISEWKRRIGAIPLVAIGGLTVERAKLCLAAGADVVAVVTDITLNADPEARAREWIAATRPA